MEKQNIEYLRDNGPAPLADLPYDQLSIGDRQAGAARFKLQIRSRGDGPSSMHQDWTIAYLFGDHDKRAVAEAWLRENAEYFGEHSGQNILSAVARSAGRSWVDPFRDAMVDLGDTEFRTDSDGKPKPAESVRGNETE